MKPPTINDAKKLAYDARAKGTLILCIGDGQHATVSYGMTRELCDAMREVNDQIADLIRAGTIKIPEALRK